MSAYVILDVEVTDPQAYESYKSQSGPTLKQFGGRFVVRGGQADVLEGDWQPARIVILEFPSLQAARDWWESDLYAGPKKLRQGASRGSMILVEGV